MQTASPRLPIQSRSPCTPADANVHALPPGSPPLELMGYHSGLTAQQRRVEDTLAAHAKALAVDEGNGGVHEGGAAGNEERD